MKLIHLHKPLVALFFAAILGSCRTALSMEKEGTNKQATAVPATSASCAPVGAGACATPGSSASSPQDSPTPGSIESILGSAYTRSVPATTYSRLPASELLFRSIGLEGSDEEAEKLIDLSLSSDVNKPDAEGDTPLHRAARFNNIALTVSLLHAHADVNAKNKKGQTPLYVACVLGNLRLARLLIDSHADLNAKDNIEFTPVHGALFHGQAPIITLLLNLAGSPQQQRPALERTAPAAASSSQSVTSLAISITPPTLTTPAAPAMTPTQPAPAAPRNETRLTVPTASQTERLHVENLMLGIKRKSKHWSL